jgi:hypothetical protein
VFTVIDCVVAPFDHVLPDALEEVKVTDPPTQNEVAPLTEITGVAGAAKILTPILDDVAEHVPLETVTL